MQQESCQKNEYARLEKKKQSNQLMAEKAKQKRDLWIGHKLGNMTTDVKIGGKESLSDAILIQKCK